MKENWITKFLLKRISTRKDASVGIGWRPEDDSDTSPPGGDDKPDDGTPPVLVLEMSSGPRVPDVARSDEGSVLETSAHEPEELVEPEPIEIISYQSSSPVKTWHDEVYPPYALWPFEEEDLSHLTGFALYAAQLSQETRKSQHGIRPELIATFAKDLAQKIAKHDRLEALRASEVGIPDLDGESWLKLGDDKLSIERIERQGWSNIVKRERIDLDEFREAEKLRRQKAEELSYGPRMR